jgi:hypothetical protein
MDRDEYVLVVMERAGVSEYIFSTLRDAARTKKNFLALCSAIDVDITGIFIERRAKPCIQRR